VALPPGPFQRTNKPAICRLVPLLGPVLGRDGVRINALRPGFADTSLVRDIGEWVASVGAPLLTVDEVVDAFMQILGSDEVGQCWFVQPGRPSEPFAFRNVPGPRARVEDA